MSTYSIQIGAYKNPPENLIKRVEKFGVIHTSKFGDITRVNVGSFKSRSKAQEFLLNIQEAGYQDAFISRLNMISATSNLQETHQSDSTSEMTKFRNLSNTDKDKAVFINGKLHLKEDNKFIPVL
ncbi:MAG: SPOR domain-containing protein [Gammaproteobacteria bacterium]|nr:SPOR domain-containing protein [Gammaproteobacteria bacterium]